MLISSLDPLGGGCLIRPIADKVVLVRLLHCQVTLILFVDSKSFVSRYFESM